MIYGDEKRQQMARSILPSKARKSARDNLRALRRHNRRAVRQDLRNALRNEDYEDQVDLCRYPYRRIRYEVRDRRDADKLNHFERWAVEITKNLPVENRLAHMRALLPKGLIGEHALEHLRFREEFMYGEHVFRFRLPRVDRMYLKEQREKADARRAKILREIVESGWGHRALHRRLHATHKMVRWMDGEEEIPVGPESPPMLQGLGQIEEWIATLHRASRKAVIPCEPHVVGQRFPSFGKGPSFRWERIHSYRANPDYHPEWRKTVDAFLDQWEKGLVRPGDPSA